MTANTLPSPTANGTAVELGRYETDLREERILLGRREDGEVCVYDAPLGGASERTYRVEAGFESKAELAMLVRDYLRQARLFGSCPMGPRAVGIIAEASKEAVA